MVVLDRDKLLKAVEPLCERACIKSDVLIAEVDIGGVCPAQLMCSLPKETFYRLPEFFVDLERSPELRNLPHVGSRGRVCSFDETASAPDPRQPEAALAMALSRTIKILGDGLSGSNSCDYEDEIAAYWDLQASGLVFVVDVPDDNIGTMHCVQGTFHGKSCACAATNKKLATSFASKLFESAVSEESAYPCLFMRLSKPIKVPIPETCSQWDEEVSESGCSFVRSYRRFLADSTNLPARVLLAVPAGEGESLVSFSQPRVPADKRFRSGETLYRYAIAALGYGETKIARHHTERVGQDRLYARGGDGIVASKRLAMVGCGSLGSLLTRAFADCGVNNFVLIDRDVLGVENVARHVCGFNHVGERKPSALSKYLQARNPNVSCEVHLEDANDLLDIRPLVFNGCDAVLVTAADSPLEFHFIQKMMVGSVSVPVVIMWVEPFALVAHALILNKPQDIYSKYYDNGLSFNSPGVLNSSSFLKRESGCQSSFVPYSGIDVQSFAIAFVRDFEKLTAGDNNYHFNWVGRISRAGDFGAIIAYEYVGRPDYSYFVERID